MSVTKFLDAVTHTRSANLKEESVVNRIRFVRDRLSGERLGVLGR